MSRVQGGLAVLVGALLMAACGPEAPSPTPSPTAFVQATPTITTYHLNTGVWYAGLVLTFGTTTAELDAHGGRVSVEALIKNPNRDDRTLAAPIHLDAGGAVFEPTRESVLPTIPAGLSASTTLDFEVVGLASVDDAVLIVGAPGDHLGVVPFGEGVPPVTLEPVAFKPSGTVAAGELRLALRSGELRWDLPDWAEELPSGSAALTLTYDVTNKGTFSGGNPLTERNVELRLPDGTLLRPRADGRSQSTVLLRPGRTAQGLFSRFEIPAGLSGTCVLILHDAGDEAKLRFKLPG